MIKPYLVFILHLILIVIPLNGLSTDNTIRITNGEWEPYMSEYSSHYGLASHIVSEALMSEGVNIRWGFFPWKRSLIVAKEGVDWDASCCWWPSDEIDRHFYISDPVTTSTVVFFHLKEFSFDWKSIDDLTWLKVGITSEYEYGKAFMDAVTNNTLKVETVLTDEQNYKKLLAHRIHIFPNDLTVGYSQIRNTFPPEQAAKFTHDTRILHTTTLNFIVSRKCLNGMVLINKFNSGLKRLKDNGKYGKMLKDAELGNYDKQK